MTKKNTVLLCPKSLRLGWGEGSFSSSFVRTNTRKPSQKKKIGGVGGKKKIITNWMVLSWMTHTHQTKWKTGIFTKTVLLHEVQAASTTRWRLQGSHTMPSISKETYFPFSNNVPLFQSIRQYSLRMSPLTFTSENTPLFRKGLMMTPVILPVLVWINRLSYLPPSPPPPNEWS